jgi:hypothetical protein
MFKDCTASKYQYFMKKIILFLITISLISSCKNDTAGTKEINPAGNTFFNCQVDNHGESFEVSIPNPLRIHNYYNGSTVSQEFKIYSEYFFLNGGDTCNVNLIYWTSIYMSIDNSVDGMKRMVNSIFKDDFKLTGRVNFYTITKNEIIYGVGSDDENNTAVIAYSPYFGILEIEIKNCKNKAVTERIINSMQFEKGESVKNGQ